MYFGHVDINMILKLVVRTMVSSRQLPGKIGLALFKGFGRISLKRLGPVSIKLLMVG